MDYSTPGLPVQHHLPELTQTHVHWVSESLWPSINVAGQESKDYTYLKRGIDYTKIKYSLGFLRAQLVKNLPTMQEALGWDPLVRSLGWEDPLEKRRLPTPVFWPGEFHGLYSPWGRKESDATEWLSLSNILYQEKVCFGMCFHTFLLPSQVFNNRKYLSYFSLEFCKIYFSSYTGSLAYFIKERDFSKDRQMISTFLRLFKNTLSAKAFLA